jgi:hypothetical protein
VESEDAKTATFDIVLAAGIVPASWDSQPTRSPARTKERRSTRRYRPDVLPPVGLAKGVRGSQTSGFMEPPLAVSDVRDSPGTEPLVEWA